MPHSDKLRPKRKKSMEDLDWDCLSRVNVWATIFLVRTVQLILPVCQLHGGDIGVSSKSGEGSTFGFYFKVRGQGGSPGDTRPPFSARSSDSSIGAQRSQTPRPSYGRANSNLKRIKELQNEAGISDKHNGDGGDDNDKKDDQKEPKRKEKRPPLQPLSTSPGLNSVEQGMNETLRNPPTEYCPEAHPGSSRDTRYQETAKVADNVEERRSSITEDIESRLPDLRLGETKRQELHSQDRSRSDSRGPSDTRSTLLLVEDNLINQKVLRRQLQGKGFEVSHRTHEACKPRERRPTDEEQVFVANNGQEAIDAVAERGQISSDDGGYNYFDCILMDQVRPLAHMPYPLATTIANTPPGNAHQGRQRRNGRDSRTPRRRQSRLLPDPRGLSQRPRSPNQEHAGSRHGRRHLETVQGRRAGQQDKKPAAEIGERLRNGRTK